jgi:hypothetical protein
VTPRHGLELGQLRLQGFDADLGSAPLRLCGEDDGGDEHEGSSDENDG